MKCLFRIMFIFVLSIVPLGAMSQIVTYPEETTLNSDSLRKEFDSRPYFGLYKDNYFIFGPSLNKRPDKTNTNVKFQVSIQQRLTNRKFPFGAYLYLFYTQKVQWNILEESLPMTDLSFNPGIGIAKPIFSKNKFIGKVCLQIEHESNGKDSIASRSWNKVSFSSNILITKNLMVHGKVWIPIIDGEHNKDILKYCGVYQFGIQAKSLNERWRFGMTFVKLKGWNLNHNIVIDAHYYFSRKADWAIYTQLYCGYGENLLEYNIYKCQLRAGIVISPKFFSDY